MKNSPEALLARLIQRYPWILRWDATPQAYRAGLHTEDFGVLRVGLRPEDFCYL